MKLALAIQTPEVQPIVPVALISGRFEEKLDKAARWGVDGVELMTADPAALDVESIAASVHRAGLEVAAIGSGAVSFATGLTLLNGDGELARQARARACDLIEFAAAVGAPVVTVGSFRGRLASVGKEGHDRLVRTMHDLAVFAAAYDVRLALEPLNRFESDLIQNCEEGLALLRQVDHRAWGLVLDTFHVNIEERSWTEPFNRAMAAGQLWHVHLGDNNRLAPGQGLIDFPAIVATLRDGSYDGYLSAELLALPDPDTAALQTTTYMRAIMGD
jgi:sugar phosphate isomerase/epimerase